MIVWAKRHLKQDFIKYKGQYYHVFVAVMHISYLMHHALLFYTIWRLIALSHSTCIVLEIVNEKATVNGDDNWSSHPVLY